MRRAVQFHLEKNEDCQVELAEDHEALEEMIFRGGALNVKVLGGAGMEVNR